MVGECERRLSDGCICGGALAVECQSCGIVRENGLANLEALLAERTRERDEARRENEAMHRDFSRSLEECTTDCREAAEREPEIRAQAQALLAERNAARALAGQYVETIIEMTEPLVVAELALESAVECMQNLTNWVPERSVGFFELLDELKRAREALGK